MPEGDTIAEVAAFMAPRLTGRLLERVRLAGRPSPELARRRVAAVEAHGKHLLVRCAGNPGWTLRVHLGMHGSWHVYRAGERWQRPAYTANVVLEAEGTVFVCFAAEDVACLRGAAPATPLAGLGPDILAPEFAPDRAAARARAILPHAPLVDVLLDQRVVAGIGNVYKCEVLFLAGLAPLTQASALPDPALTALFARTQALMHTNLGGWMRTTTVDRRAASPPRPGGRLWVYGRVGRPCRRCATRLVRALLGRHRRQTTWCPACQPDPLP